jgi:hypothetical protein
MVGCIFRHTFRRNDSDRLEDDNKMNRIFVAGYPKSGNTWLARLLGEIYDAPVSRWRSALPLACEGQERRSETVIHQLHLRPVPMNDPPYAEAIDHAYKWDWRQPLRQNDRIVYIVRDVRDVIVSAYFYWQRETFHEAVAAVLDGGHPLGVHGSWQHFQKLWFDALLRSDDDIMVCKYEQLSSRPVEVLDSLTRGRFPAKWLREAVNAQSFEATVKRIQNDGDDRPYGKTIQLRNLRKGVVGDWRNHFTSPLAYAVEEKCGKMLRELGYESKGDWWKNV